MENDEQAADEKPEKKAGEGFGALIAYAMFGSQWKEMLKAIVTEFGKGMQALLDERDEARKNALELLAAYEDRSHIVGDDVLAKVRGYENPDADVTE
jgi:hypothetical protein